MSLKIAHHNESGPNLIGMENLYPPEQASKSRLLWSYFPGEVEVGVDGAQIVSVGANVPALHFVASMIASRESLSESEDSTSDYFFTEIDYLLIFRRLGHGVYIEASFSEVKMTVSFAEFSLKVFDFALAKIHELGREYPALLSHPYVRELLLACGTNPLDQG